jgi:DNA-binding response OmpR family regulator
MTATHEDCQPGGLGLAWAGAFPADPVLPGPVLPGPVLPGPAVSRILVVDDEPHISGFVSRALENAGYQVDVAADAVDGVRRATERGYNLIVLDLIMPDLDGRAALSAILATHPDQAVLVLSCNSDVSTKVECLDLGARDYLTKPFSLAELTARVRAALRDTAKRNEVMRVGGLVLDAGRLVADSGAGPVALTRLEFLCLRALMEYGGGSVAKSELLASVWGIDFDPGSNIVDVCIRRLRAKLGFGLIETVRGEGYRLAS